MRSRVCLACVRLVALLALAACADTGRVYRELTHSPRRYMGVRLVTHAIVGRRVTWRLFEDDGYARLTMERDGDHIEYAGPVMQTADNIVMALRHGEQALTLECKREMIDVHPRGARLRVRCPDGAEWSTPAAPTIVLACSQGRLNSWVFADAPIEDVTFECCGGDVCREYSGLRFASW